MTDNKSVLVITGTSKGIGKAIAEYYLGKGFIVCGCSRSDLCIPNENYFHSILDIKDENSVRAWIKNIKRDLNKIDFLICNAGNATANRLMTLTTGTVAESVVLTNILGSFYVCREVAKIMILQKKGRIINISSMSVGLHEEGTSIYSASKSAIVEYTKILAKELSSSNITCNVIAPSMYITEAVEALGEDIKRRALDKLTIKRVLTIEEICNVISFYFSDKSSSITGQVIHMGLVC
jgi:3-oxoacyl-[acyl-carrier protein] reductase